MTTIPFELSFTVRPEHDFDVEKLGRLAGSLIPHDVDTTFGVRAVHVFRCGGPLLYTNYDIERIPDRETADKLHDAVRREWPHVYVPGPTQDRPDDVDWVGMFTEEGGNRVHALINRAIELMSNGGTVGALEQALVFVRAETEVIGRTHGEVHDTDVREQIWDRVEAAALERGFTQTLFNELCDRCA